MAVTLRKSLKIIEDYKMANPHYADLLDILADILILREEYRKNMKESIFQVEEKLIAQKMEGGLPLVDIAGSKHDLTRPKKYFESLIAIAQKRMPEAGQDILSIIHSDDFDWEKMIKSSFDRAQEDLKNDAPAETEVLSSSEERDNFDLIDLFAEESLRPELEYIAEKYGAAVEKAGWSEGYCPICGKEPKIGEIRAEEDGRRYLFCNQCGFKWHFRRITCPFCGNDEQQSLAYFAVEGEERHRVDVCNKCRRYIKIVELPKSSEEPNLDVEDIATLHLDMIAYDEGYN
ncbi:MAG TPA: formate dehydrogenase accessory protein FdhE [Smithellaceae bacterium]|nr:formate dehydrogenase accessory protein FdhE [Smithellaceae bacterium]HRS88197.1 formate dehydrogenase accessory protein FdhE [Smithellaceae bacterium]HRV25695.1 formate dehydrogenase accessory protein FdhE [Smithellaceae bacterium]